MTGLIATPAKPVPIPDEASRPFFEGARQGLLLLRRCHGCGTFMSPVGGIGTPLRPRCVSCFSPDLEWAPAGGRGTLYSFALMHQVYDPAFADDVPLVYSSTAGRSGSSGTSPSAPPDASPRSHAATGSPS